MDILLYRMGCPIRTSTVYQLLASNRGFSQPVTSFFSVYTLGILPKHTREWEPFRR